MDRNALALASAKISHRSLSARRAWIEIACIIVASKGTPGRSPQGERG